MDGAASVNSSDDGGETGVSGDRAGHHSTAVDGSKRGRDEGSTAEAVPTKRLKESGMLLKDPYQTVHISHARDAPAHVGRL